MTVHPVNMMVMTTSGTGTGSLELVPVAGWRTATEAAGTGETNLFWYTVRHTVAGEYEIGRGYVDPTTGHLIRHHVVESSNGDALVDFTAGVKEITSSAPLQYLQAIGVDRGTTIDAATESTIVETVNHLLDRLQLKTPPVPIEDAIHVWTVAPEEISGDLADFPYPICLNATDSPDLFKGPESWKHWKIMSGGVQCDAEVVLFSETNADIVVKVPSFTTLEGGDVRVTWDDTPAVHLLAYTADKDSAIVAASADKPPYNDNYAVQGHWLTGETSHGGFLAQGTSGTPYTIEYTFCDPVVVRDFHCGGAIDEPNEYPRTGFNKLFGVTSDGTEVFLVDIGAEDHQVHTYSISDTTEFVKLRYKYAGGSSSWNVVGSVSIHVDLVTAYIGQTSTPAAMAVWDNHFEWVGHLLQDPLAGGACILDSTRHTRHAVPGGLTKGATGLIFPSAGDGALNIPLDAALALSGVTFEAYFKPSSYGGGGYGRLIQIGDGTNGKVDLYLTEPETIKFRINDSTSADATGISLINQKVYAAGTYDGAEIKLSLDGVLAAQKSYTAAISQSLEFNIGNWSHTDTSRGFDGEYYEARVSSVARSDAWQKATRKSLEGTLGTYSKIDLP